MPTYPFKGLDPNSSDFLPEVMRPTIKQELPKILDEISRRSGDELTAIFALKDNVAFTGLKALLAEIETGIRSKTFEAYPYGTIADAYNHGVRKGKVDMIKYITKELFSGIEEELKLRKQGPK